MKGCKPERQRETEREGGYGSEFNYYAGKYKLKAVFVCLFVCFVFVAGGSSEQNLPAGQMAQFCHLLKAGLVADNVVSQLTVVTSVQCNS